MPKETYYFSHDYGARNDPKLQKVLQKLGHEGKSVYWDIIEMIFEQGGKLLLSECDSYAFALRTDESCIIRLVNDFGLFENDGKYFWSESAKRRLDDRNSKSEKARSSANNRWKNANAQNNDANALQTHSDSNAIKESKVNESKVNERRDYTREEFFKSVLEFFGFSEISNFSNYKLLTEFCHSLAGSDRLENFKTQFENYRKLKLMTGFKHNFIKFLGKQEEKFEDGAWCLENWEQRLNEELKIQYQKTGKPPDQPDIPDVPDDKIYNLLSTEKKKEARDKWKIRGHYLITDGKKSDQGWYLKNGTKATPN